jgi:hypothetical protein
MGRLVRIINGEIAIAHRYVATPDYILYVADYAGGVPPPHGWIYYEDDVEQEDFAQPWKQPLGAEDSYILGAIVLHNDITWRSTIINNVWEPGVSGWVNATSDIPVWIQPLGAQDAYSKDALVSHSTKLWISLLDGNVWEPGISGWRETAMVPPGDEPYIPDWVQPSGAHDAYPLDALVRHNGSVWKSLYAANVWEPGVFGWELQ